MQSVCELSLSIQVAQPKHPRIQDVTSSNDHTSKLHVDKSHDRMPIPSLGIFKHNINMQREHSKQKVACSGQSALIVLHIP